MDDLLKILIDKYFPAGVSDKKRLDIIGFIAEKLYVGYNEYCMNRETVIENKINSLDIVLPNAKVGDYYSRLIKIEDEDILEYWIEGLEDTGLNVELEVCVEEDNQVFVAEETECVGEDCKPDGCSGLQDDESTIETGNVIGKNFRGLEIKGTPSVAGDYDVVLKYRYKGWYEGCRVLERKFRFAINPDPRSLWKDIPTDKNIKFFKEDLASEYLTVYDNDKGSQKDIVAASKRGRSHAHEGKPRDDDFKLYHNSGNGWYVIAVADGAGSAKYSRKGSDVACETCVEHCKQALECPAELEEAIAELKQAGEGSSNRTISTLIYNIVGGAAHKAHRAILEMANANEDQIRDYSTTLLLAICKKFDFGWFVASFWVGDGAMCIYDKKRQYIRLLGTPDGGEYAGQTRFLTMAEIFTPESIMSRLKYSIEEDFTALMLMTDGVSDPFFETDANLNKVEKWDELWNNILKEVDLKDDNTESQYQLLKWLDFWSPGNHDDRTIAILY